VPGELSDWCGEVKTAWSAAVSLVRHHARELHPQQYQEMSSEDPESLPRTEKLQEDDRSLEEECDEFERALDRFVEHAPKFEPDEEKISKHAQTLIEAGVELVTKIRRQEAAVQTWYVEAFTRDRGVAD
jgi:myosin heavy subunit